MSSGLIIIGAHEGAVEEIKNIPKVIFYDYMAIGVDAVEKYPFFLKYFATYHPEDIKPTYHKRHVIGGNTDFKIISHRSYPGVDIIIPFKEPSGSSALLGAQAGIKFLYQKIILCGCPLEGIREVKNRDGKITNKFDYSQFQKGWIADKELVKDKVRSMSGFTMDFLGYPTEEWLLDGK